MDHIRHDSSRKIAFDLLRREQALLYKECTVSDKNFEIWRCAIKAGKVGGRPTRQQTSLVKCHSMSSLIQKRSDHPGKNVSQ